MSEITQAYLQAREEEELALQTNLSIKRKLLIEQSFAEDASESPQPTKMIRPTEDFVSVLRRKANEAYPRYSSLGTWEKAICRLAYNSVIPLTEDAKVYLGIGDTEFDVFKNKNQYGTLSLMDNSSMAASVSAHLHLPLGPKDRFLDSLQLIPLASSTYERQIFRIYSFLLEQHVYRQGATNNWRNMTEADIIVRYYTPIFDIIFENSRLHYRLSESENNESNEGAKVGEFYDGQSASKVGMRIVLRYFDGKKHIFFDLANADFAKNGDINRNSTSDCAKVMLEGKYIIDQLAKVRKLRMKQAKKLRVMNMQVCGMKATLVGIQLESGGRGYVSQKINDALGFPTSPREIPFFIKHTIPLFYLFKETAEANAELLQHELNRDTSSYGAQTPEIKQEFIKETWLGPNEGSQARVPPHPANFLRT